MMAVHQRKLQVVLVTCYFLLLPKRAIYPDSFMPQDFELLETGLFFFFEVNNHVVIESKGTSFMPFH
jgi:hypothetical protein